MFDHKQARFLLDCKCRVNDCKRSEIGKPVGWSVRLTGKRE
jgi:hypothetical protein